MNRIALQRWCDPTAADLNPGCRILSNRAAIDGYIGRTNRNGGSARGTCAFDYAIGDSQCARPGNTDSGPVAWLRRLGTACKGDWQPRHATDVKTSRDYHRSARIKRDRYTLLDRQRSARIYDDFIDHVRAAHERQSCVGDYGEVAIYRRADGATTHGIAPLLLDDVWVAIQNDIASVTCSRAIVIGAFVAVFIQRAVIPGRAKWIRRRFKMLVRSRRNLNIGIKICVWRYRKCATARRPRGAIRHIRVDNVAPTADKIAVIRAISWVTGANRAIQRIRAALYPLRSKNDKLRRAVRHPAIGGDGAAHRSLHISIQ